MNTKPRKFTRELPGWFDIRKYDNAWHLGARGWLHELLRRRYDDPDGDPWRYPPYGIEARATETPSRETPVDPLTDQSLVRSMRLREAISLSSRVAPTGLEPRDSPHFDLALDEFFVLRDKPFVPIRGRYFENDESFEAAKQQWQEQQRAILEEPAFDVEMRRWQRSRQCHVMIDTTAPEEEVLDEFRMWLREARERYHPVSTPHRFKAPNFVKWAESAALPYIDLEHFARKEGLRISQGTIALAIRAKYMAQDSPLGETKKMAARLMQYETILELHAYCRK